jgi:putative transcription factor
MPARGEMNGQQWETVTFGSKALGNKTTVATPATKPSATSVLVPSNRAPGPTVTKSGKTAAQLEDETEELKHQSVAPELKRAIMQARNAKRMTQKDLALQLGCDSKTVQEYESGRAIRTTRSSRRWSARWAPSCRARPASEQLPAPQHNRRAQESAPLPRTSRKQRVGDNNTSRRERGRRLGLQRRERMNNGMPW